MNLHDIQEEALSKFVDELVEGKEPRIVEFLEHHVPAEKRVEAAQNLKTALLTHAALHGIEVPAQWEEEDRARAIEETIRRYSVSQPRRPEGGFIDRLGHLFKRKR